MHTSLTLPERAAATTPPARVQERWRRAARLGWWAVTIIYTSLFILGLPVSFQRFITVCEASVCPDVIWGILTPAEAQALHQWGLPLTVYGAYVLSWDLLAAVVFLGAGLLLYHRRANEWIAYCTSLSLIVFGLWLIPAAPHDLKYVWSWYAWLEIPLGLPAQLVFIVFLFLLPDGRFVPRWSRWVALLFYILLMKDVIKLALAFVGGYENPFSFVELIPSLVCLGVAFYGQFHRYRNAAIDVVRQQMKWVGFGVIFSIAGILTYTLFVSLVEIAPGAQRLATTMTGAAVSNLSGMIFPVALTFAILRHRLWDIDLVLNRTLVYGGLTAAIVALYALIVGGLSALFHTQLSPVIAYLGVGVAALLFQPLRERLQRAVNRLMFGQRDEPYAVLARFGRQLETTPALNTLLPTITATIKETLKLPVVKIEVNSEQSSREAVSEHAERSVSLATDHGSLITFPLLYQTEPVGRLVVAPREGETALSATDRRLLEDLARQAGVAVHAARVTAELQNARERLVTAREEERRRLRRDLHDGLGPKLAGQALILEAVRDSLEPNAQNRMLVEHLIEDSQTIVVEVRELVHGLRPPALDEFGLVSALRVLAAQCESGGLHVTVTAPGPLPPLPAAVEVAAYRIVQEALTNVVKHARATACTVSLTVNEDLRLAVEDDGVGLAPDRRAGVGLLSMRERAEEIGGRCVIERGSRGGTRVTVRLPRSG